MIKNNPINPFTIMLLGDGDVPAKPDTTILTKDEFLEFLEVAIKFYNGVTEEEIKEHNYEVLYKRYIEFGATPEEATNMVFKELVSNV